jgi:hypothetical protein
VLSAEVEVVLGVAREAEREPAELAPTIRCGRAFSRMDRLVLVLVSDTIVALPLFSSDFICNPPKSISLSLSLCVSVAMSVSVTRGGSNKDKGTTACCPTFACKCLLPTPRPPPLSEASSSSSSSSCWGEPAGVSTALKFFSRFSW